MHVNITGKAFSSSNTCLLDGICRSRGYKSHKWISTKLASLLQLHRRSSNEFIPDIPANLTAMNKNCFFHNIDVYCESEEEIQKKFTKMRENLSTNDTVNDEFICPSKRYTLSDMPYPRNTNGEFFSSPYERKILDSYHDLMKISPYWVTGPEASFVYQAPLIRCNNEMPCVTVPINGFLVSYYHASFTSNPSIFTATNCRRYDPYNFFGVHYRPTTALIMKRYAIQHQCCSFPRWVTLQRAQHYGVDILRGVAPLSLILRNEVVQLINVGLTTNPGVLENEAVRPICLSSIHEEIIQKNSYHNDHI